MFIDFDCLILYSLRTDLSSDGIEVKPASLDSPRKRSHAVLSTYIAEFAGLTDVLTLLNKGLAFVLIFGQTRGRYRIYKGVPAAGLYDPYPHNPGQDPDDPGTIRRGTTMMRRRRNTLLAMVFRQISPTGRGCPTRTLITTSRR